MTTRHGDRFKIGGSKHIKTYIPASRKMQFLPWGKVVRFGILLAGAARSYIAASAF